MEGSILSFIVFTVLASLFLLTKYFMKRRLSNKDVTSSGNNIKVITILFYGILFVSQFFINYDSTKQVCGFYQPVTAFFTTLIPWIFIFGTLNILLLIFPGWKAPFSNTIGFIVTKLAGIESLFRDMLIKSDANTKLIDQIYKDPSPLINEFTPATFEDTITAINKTQGQPVIDTKNESNLYKLYNFVLLKDTVSELIWYMLTGALVASAAYNFIANSPCKRSIAYMKQQRADWEAENNKEPAKKQKKIYKIRE